MGLISLISWCHATWNPWQGCAKVSAECARCYMFRDKLRYGQDPRQVVRSAPGTFGLPLARYGARSTKGEPGSYKIPPGSRVFTCSWSDWFHQDADPWRAEAWEVIRQRPDLVFLVLTKRADRIAGHLPPGWGNGWPNVWLGVTVGAQASTWRLEALAEVPAAVRFVSAEPLLERVDFGPRLAAMDWLITGGESGPDSRPLVPAWALEAEAQGRAYGLAVHHKQNGEWATLDALDAAGQARIAAWSPAELEARRQVLEGVELYRVGTEAAGRHLGGRVLAEFPRVRPSLAGGPDGANGRLTGAP